MKKRTKIVAMVCIFTTLFMGCYSSVLIDPKGDEKEKIYSGRIKSILTKDGKKYEFSEAPSIVKDVIVGKAVLGWNPSTWASDSTQVSIPVSEVTEVWVSEFSAWQTSVASLLFLGILGGLFLLSLGNALPT